MFCSLAENLPEAMHSHYATLHGIFLTGLQVHTPGQFVSRQQIAGPRRGRRGGGIRNALPPPDSCAWRRVPPPEKEKREGRAFQVGCS